MPDQPFLEGGSGRGPTGFLTKPIRRPRPPSATVVGRARSSIVDRQAQLRLAARESQRSGVRRTKRADADGDVRRCPGARRRRRSRIRPIRAPSPRWPPPFPNECRSRPSRARPRPDPPAIALGQAQGKPLPAPLHQGIEPHVLDHAPLVPIARRLSGCQSPRQERQHERVERLPRVRRWHQAGEGGTAPGVPAPVELQAQHHLERLHGVQDPQPIGRQDDERQRGRPGMRQRRDERGQDGDPSPLLGREPVDLSSLPSSTCLAKRIASSLP